MRALVVGIVLLAACGDGSSTTPLTYGTMKPLIGEEGRGGWRFGVATASAQIEDMNPNTDWYVFTQPTAQGGLGRHTFVGDATRGYTKWMDDLALVADLGVDSYRFSIEWARIEPQRDVIDESAIAHYRLELEALRAMGIRPLVTVHHFSNPVWTADPRNEACTGGPTDQNLCGFGGPGGPPLRPGRPGIGVRLKYSLSIRPFSLNVLPSRISTKPPCGMEAKTVAPSFVIAAS